jgi:LPXTG-motif cell wall-anchored protein
MQALRHHAGRPALHTERSARVRAINIAIWELAVLTEGYFGLYGQWLSTDGTLSDIQVIDSGWEVYLDAQNSNAETDIEADRVLNQHVEYDPATGLVHAVYHKQFYGTPDSQDEDTTADDYHIHAFYTVYDPVAEVVVEENVMSEEFPLDSSRPVIDLGPGGMALVYQDWSNGDWEDPSEVRFYSVAGDNLAATGFGSTDFAVGAVLALIAGAGVYAVRRRRVNA